MPKPPGTPRAATYRGSVDEVLSELGQIARKAGDDLELITSETDVTLALGITLEQQAAASLRLCGAMRDDLTRSTKALVIASVRAGLSQSQVAKSLGVQPHTIGSWVREASKTR